MAQLVKISPAVGDTWVRSLGWEDPLEEGIETCFSILAWIIPMYRGAWWATVHRVPESYTTERLAQHIIKILLKFQVYNLHPTNKKCLILILLANIYCFLCSRNYVGHMRYTSTQKSPLNVFKLLGWALRHLSLLHLLYIRLSCIYSFANMYHLFIKHIYVDCFHCARHSSGISR